MSKRERLVPKGIRMIFGADDGTGYAGGVDLNYWTKKRIKEIIHEYESMNMTAIAGFHYPTEEQITIARAFYAGLKNLVVPESDED